jgi:hypothetical protein
MRHHPSRPTDSMPRGTGQTSELGRYREALLPCLMLQRQHVFQMPHRRHRSSELFHHPPAQPPFSS